MTIGDVIDFFRKRKRATLAVSVLLHLLVLGGSLMTFSARSVIAPPEDLVPVDIISDDNTSKAKFGSMDGKKAAPKPLADKIGEKKPADNIMGKVDPKQTTETDAAPAPQPKPVEKKPDPPKPVEKKPDPPKPVVENKPKPEEKKPDPLTPDPIANALKQDEKKPVPKQQAAVTPPEPPKHKSERKFDMEKIAAAINQKDPTRQAVTGAELNANAALGTANGAADANIASWSGAFASAVARCFNFPYNGLDAEKYNVDIDIQMRPDGTVAAEPRISAVNGPSKSISDALAENAKRAVQSCQPYTFLPKDKYATWKLILTNFNLGQMNSMRGRT